MDRPGGREVDGQGHERQDEQALQRDEVTVRPAGPGICRR